MSAAAHCGFFGSGLTNIKDLVPPEADPLEPFDPLEADPVELVDPLLHAAIRSVAAPTAAVEISVFFDIEWFPSDEGSCDW